MWAVHHRLFLSNGRQGATESRARRPCHALRPIPAPGKVNRPSFMRSAFRAEADHGARAQSRQVSARRHNTGRQPFRSRRPRRRPFTDILTPTVTSSRHSGSVENSLQPPPGSPVMTTNETAPRTVQPIPTTRRRFLLGIAAALAAGAHDGSRRLGEPPVGVCAVMLRRSSGVRPRHRRSSRRRTRRPEGAGIRRRPPCTIGPTKGWRLSGCLPCQLGLAHRSRRCARCQRSYRVNGRELS